MSKFIICGCTEAVPDIITELIYNIHIYNTNNPDIDIIYYNKPIKSETNHIVYIGIKPSDLWELLSKGNMTEENRRRFNDIVSEFSRYEYCADKTIWYNSDMEITDVVAEAWNYIRNINKMEEESCE